MISALKKLCALAGTAAICCHGGNPLQVIFAPPETRPYLGAHMAEQLASRTNGTSRNMVLKEAAGTSQIYFEPGYPKIVTNFWLRDVTNYFSAGIGYIRAGTNDMGLCPVAVSPRHCLTASHVDGEALINPIFWALPDGSFYTNTAISKTNFGSDTTILLMAKTNPCWVKVLPDISGYVSFNNPGVPPAQAVRWHYASQMGPVTTFVSGMSGMGTWGVSYLWGQVNFGDYSHGDIWRNGDSGTPAYCIINNEAVLVDIAYYAQWSDCPGMNQATANRLMGILSTNAGAPVYQLTPVDLSGFRKI